MSGPRQNLGFLVFSRFSWFSLFYLGILGFLLEQKNLVNLCFLLEIQKTIVILGFLLEIQEFPSKIKKTKKTSTKPRIQDFVVGQTSKTAEIPEPTEDEEEEPQKDNFEQLKS